MSRIAYVNGAYLPIAYATVHIEDRGNQFSDGAYEGITVYDGKIIDLVPHLARLRRSLSELRISAPMGDAALTQVIKEVVRRNRTNSAMIYMQVSRGAAKRDHAFPENIKPSLIITCRRLDFAAINARVKSGVKASSQPDTRWSRCDIKSISLLPNILAKQAAREKGSFEAILVDSDGFITEGSSTNVWIVTPEGTLVTRSTDDNILPGITRSAIIRLARDMQMPIEERAFTVQEAKGASEMFLTSSSCCAQPIIAFDDAPIGDGKPGPTVKRLVEQYRIFMDAQ